MSKKKKKQNKLDKTLVEKILDQQKIAYHQAEFATHEEHGVAQMDTSILDEKERLVYKTLVCQGNVTGPLVGVVPVTEHLSMKKLAKASGNKKCEMLPLKELEKTTGYVHGANTPIGIWHSHKFPIYLDESMKGQAEIGVSSGKVGRSVFLNPQDLARVCHGKFVDILE